MNLLYTAMSGRLERSSLISNNIWCESPLVNESLYSEEGEQ